MTKYKVVSRFQDTKHEHVYEVGDFYPVEGKTASKTRLKELSTTKNNYQQVFIEEVKEEG